MAKDFPELSPQGSLVLRAFEGRINYVYDDAVAPTRKWKRGEPIRGNLTAGVGHLLSKDGVIFPEAEAWIGKTIPGSVIDQWEDLDLDVAESAVHTLVKVPLETHQRDAIIMFTYNVGVGGFGGSGLLKKLNQSKYDAVPGELAKWTKTTINGKKVTSDGLVRRRSAEASLWGSVGVQTSLISTPIKAANKPPVATEMAEATSQPTTLTEYATSGVSIATAAAGFTQTSGVLSYAFAAVVVIAAVVLAAILIKRNFFAS